MKKLKIVLFFMFVAISHVRADAIESLFIAMAEKGKVIVFRKLIDKWRFDYNISRDALFRAVSNGHLSIVKVLLQRRDKFNFNSEDFLAAAEKAEACGHVGVALYMMRLSIEYFRGLPH